MDRRFHLRRTCSQRLEAAPAGETKVIDRRFQKGGPEVTDKKLQIEFPSQLFL